MNDNIRELGQIIYELRKKKCLSREGLEDKSGKIGKTISNVEHGADTKWSTIIALASALDMNLGDLNPCIGKAVPNQDGNDQDVV